MVYLREFINEERIAFFEPSSKKEALSRLIDLSRSDKFISDFDGFRKEIFEREEMVSTGIGQGVAIPHIKSKNVKEFFITLGVFRKGVEWESLDGKPVHIAFLIGGPEDHQKYLQILAKLTLIIRNPERRKALIASEGPKAVLAQFEGI
jgi:fructose-specific phosphotransferase system IIA component